MHDLRMTDFYIDGEGTFGFLGKIRIVNEYHVDIGQYAANIRSIYDQLSASAAAVIFATITPVPASQPDCAPPLMKRRNEDVLAYNTAALDALPSDARINDLYSRVVAACGEGFAVCDLMPYCDVHYVPAGRSYLAENVSYAVLSAVRSA